MGTLFHMTERAAIGMHAVLCIARSDTPMTAKRIASALDVSQDHTVKVLNRLSRSGLLRAVRGPNGGFSLKVPPEKISLLAVYEAIDGELLATSCLFREMKCPSENCLFSGLADSVNGLVHDYLSSRTVADMKKLKPRDEGGA